ncbi:ROK family protein [Lactiplantibacillus pentosus]|uniref:ROK family protein n=1 Tax=Lactiplantibacillus pentosus TaxID=1589 RepID=A0AAW8VW28_LACPE|nr:ROK family protein [Lactiplantibacillus pentosus]MBU7473804.1 ROK family protein [Lactiplantibacillus pentosus]MBU7528918.1 ROK family protein [Lactiplantibacillus pentosus]MCT3304899.1 ROK family protein [Lactiplantibacillus pentosus]MDT6990294.1 ROK family protein [Lactiplantibacillus pentosus]
MTMYIGIDIGGTSIKCGLVDGNGHISRKVTRTTATTKSDIMADLVAMVQELQTDGPVAGIGVSMPGVVQSDGFLTTAGAVTAFEQINLRDELQAQTKLPVIIENDANAAAIAEQWLGVALIINNQVYRGAHARSGEFGWMVVDDDDIDIEMGTLNFRGATVIGLIRRYNQFSTDTVNDAREIFKRAAAGETLAKHVFHSYYYSLAKGIINLMVAFDPEIVVIGGGISANETFMTNLNATIADLHANHNSIKQLKLAPVVPARLRNDAGMIGAVYQLIKRG